MDGVFVDAGDCVYATCCDMLQWDMFSAHLASTNRSECPLEITFPIRDTLHVLFRLGTAAHVVCAGCRMTCSSTQSCAMQQVWTFTGTCGRSAEVTQIRGGQLKL